MKPDRSGQELAGFRVLGVLSNGTTLRESGQEAERTRQAPPPTPGSNQTLGVLLPPLAVPLTGEQT